MNFKSLGFLIICTGFGFYLTGSNLTKFELKGLKFYQSDLPYEMNNDYCKILYVCIGLAYGGVEVHTLALYEHFFNKGFDVSLLISENSKFEEEAKKRKFSYYTTDALKFNSESVNFSKTLYSHVYRICKDKNIEIIHSNKTQEYKAVNVAAKRLGICVIANYHCANVSRSFCSSKLREIDVFISANPLISKKVKKLNKQLQLGIKRVEFIFPPCEEEKFLDIEDIQKDKKKIREVFFKEEFNISLKQIPLACVVANFYPCKNHKLILYALHQLIYQEDCLIQVAFAGCGSYNLERSLKKLAESLKIDEFVYFFGIYK